MRRGALGRLALVWGQRRPECRTVTRAVCLQASVWLLVGAVWAMDERSLVVARARLRDAYHED